MRVYVSGSWSGRARLRQMAERLRMMGHEVVSSWLDEQDCPEWLPREQWHARLASKDVTEVYMADAIIMDLHDTSTTGGRYVEWGVACNPRSYILRVLVGPEDHPFRAMFGTLADYKYADWNALLAGPVFNVEVQP